MNTDVEDLLRTGMERFTSDLRAPDGLMRRVVQRRRRRLAQRSAGAAAALAVGAVALTVVLVPGGHEASIDTTAYVVKQVDSALSAAGPGDIAQMTVTTSGAGIPSGTTATTAAEEWSYGDQWRSVTYSSPGHPVYDEGFSASSVYTLVNYQSRTWARQPGLGRPAEPLPAPGAGGCGLPISAIPFLFRSGLPGIGSLVSSLPETVARAARAAVSCGTLTVAGRQRVDGIETIELTSRPDSPLFETIWVAPDTYLPLRLQIRSSTGAPALKLTADITWLQPTGRNLAKLTVPIPTGFHRVSVTRAVTSILALIPVVPLQRFPGDALSRLTALCAAGMHPAPWQLVLPASAPSPPAVSGVPLVCRN